jgi:sulfate adenylyltransferase large subunit
MSAALQLPPANDPAPARSSRPADLLRMLTCGSVDDGKSTLLGRLLFDANAVMDDQLAALDRDSKRFGTGGQERDFALLVDGLSAEREQGITIDVAYRYFSTARRSFIVADTPGHEQYTRNMATGASTADLAIILVDARKGLLPQTLRHSYIVSMVGVRHVVLAVNKMDLVGFAEETYRQIETAYRRTAETLGFESIVVIPLCARSGDNIVNRSPRMRWYGGPPLLGYLETVSVGRRHDGGGGFRMPVQWVNRPNADFRGYAGTLASGMVRVGDTVTALPSGRSSAVAQLLTPDGNARQAIAGQPVTLVLRDEIDISRGDVLVAATDSLAPTKRVTARILSMGDDGLSTQDSLIIKLGPAVANAHIARVINVVDINSFGNRPAERLDMNQVGLVELEFDKPLVAEAYRRNGPMGAFILIDRVTNHTVGMGVVEAVTATDAAAPVTAGPAEVSVETVRTVAHVLVALALAGVVTLTTGNANAALAAGFLAAIGALSVNRFAKPLRLARGVSGNG